MAKRLLFITAFFTSSTLCILLIGKNELPSLPVQLPDENDIKTEIGVKINNEENQRSRIPVLAKVVGVGGTGIVAALVIATVCKNRGCDKHSNKSSDFINLT